MPWALVVFLVVGFRLLKVGEVAGGTGAGEGGGKDEKSIAGAGASGEGGGSGAGGGGAKSREKEREKELGKVMSVAEFSITAGLGNVNLFAMVRYFEESKILQKLHGCVLYVEPEGAGVDMRGAAHERQQEIARGVGRRA